jgi:hypothetical protein
MYRSSSTLSQLHASQALSAALLGVEGLAVGVHVLVGLVNLVFVDDICLIIVVGRGVGGGVRAVASRIIAHQLAEGEVVLFHLGADVRVQLKEVFVLDLGQRLVEPLGQLGGEFTKLKQSFKQRFKICVKKLRMK